MLEFRCKSSGHGVTVATSAHSPGLWFFSPCGGFRNRPGRVGLLVFQVLLHICAHVPTVHYRPRLILTLRQTPTEWPQTSHLLPGVLTYRSRRVGWTSLCFSQKGFCSNKLYMISVYCMCVCICVLWSECLHPPNSYGEILMLNVMGLGGGAFRRGLGHQGRTLVNGKVPLSKRPERTP